MQVGTASGAELEVWQGMALSDTAPLYALREPAGPARAMGADNAALLGF